MIELLTSGQLNSIQDLGRPGFLDQGIARGGAMDRPAIEVANLLLGNDPDAAGIEIAIFPFRLRFHAATIFSVTGAICPAMVDGQKLPPWWTKAVRPGSELRIDAPVSGARAYVAFAGGIQVAPVLGSRATDLKSLFGGLDGRPLRRGDRLMLGENVRAYGGNHGADPRWFGRTGEAANLLRVMPGAEFNHFTEEAQRALTSAAFTVSADNNRQGMRLEGVGLSLTAKLELHSHGIMPGTIQVPPSGQPVIQLAEANTCGGYPKFAHVIEADLWKLAQAPSGTALRFEVVDQEQAVEAIRQERALMRKLANLVPVAADMKKRVTQR